MSDRDGLSGAGAGGSGQSGGSDQSGGSREPGSGQSGGSDNTMRLVKWLVIIGIGIPVLVEVLTLFNLVQVRLFEGEDPASEVRSQDPAAATDGLSVLGAGDRLTFEGDVPVLRLEEKMIMVAPEEWQFTLSLAPDSLSVLSEGVQFRFFVDSLRLRSGELLEGKGPFRWPLEGEGVQGQPEIQQFLWRWAFPPGDLPQRVFVRFEWEGGAVVGAAGRAEAERDSAAGVAGIAEDSLRVVRREFSLGNIPTRYQEGASSRSGNQR
ncbi:MAG: hypothetical protein U5K31_03035 [Balneolaceae bacterium]|nr:hypothetical protein [Balneolaceae bacterium]